MNYCRRDGYHDVNFATVFHSPLKDSTLHTTILPALPVRRFSRSARLRSRRESYVFPSPIPGGRTPDAARTKTP